MPKPSGGQKGNKNALKHGIYSKFILLAHDAALKGMSDKSVKDELAMACVCFIQAKENKDNATDPKDVIAWDAACHNWLSLIINTKLQVKEVDQAAGTVFDTFFEAVERANDVQNIK
jgi:hypothetical protein